MSFFDLFFPDVFFQSCGPNSDCDDAHWVLPLVVAFAFAFAAFLVKTTGNDVRVPMFAISVSYKFFQGSGALGVMLFFYQSLVMRQFGKSLPRNIFQPLVKSTQWKNESIAPGIDFLEAIFSELVCKFLPSIHFFLPDFSPKGISSSASICVYENMNAFQKIGSKIIFQLTTALCLVIICIAHVVSFFGRGRPLFSHLNSRFCRNFFSLFLPAIRSVGLTTQPPSCAS